MRELELSRPRRGSTSLLSCLLHCGILLLVVGCNKASSVERIAPPRGVVVLQITGEIEHTNVDDTLALDLNMIQKLPEREIRTTTIWTSGEQVFRGVSAADAVGIAGPRGDRIEASASDGYEVVLSLEALSSLHAVLATEMNGEPLEGTKYGPLWIVYDYDSLPPDDRERAINMSPWALSKATIVSADR